MFGRTAIAHNVITYRNQADPFGPARCHRNGRLAGFARQQAFHARPSQWRTCSALARFKHHKPLRVAAVLESERTKGLSMKAQQRARNHLDAAPSFQGDIQGAMDKLAELAAPSVLH